MFHCVDSPSGQILQHILLAEKGKSQLVALAEIGDFISARATLSLGLTDKTNR